MSLELPLVGRRHLYRAVLLDKLSQPGFELSQRQSGLILGTPPRRVHEQGLHPLVGLIEPVGGIAEERNARTGGRPLEAHGEQERLGALGLDLLGSGPIHLDDGFEAEHPYEPNSSVIRFGVGAEPEVRQNPCRSTSSL